VKQRVVVVVVVVGMRGGEEERQSTPFERKSGVSFHSSLAL